MIQEDLLIKVVNEINQLDIPYMITGGIAVVFYGRPRLTHDFDIVVEISSDQIKTLTETFEKEFYVSKEAIKEAIDKRSMFNLIHLESGIKIDFWLLHQDDRFDRKRFERRQKHHYSEREIIFSSPEDIVLKKLLWFKESGIEKHLDDALGIVEIQQKLDMVYLAEWAKELTVQNLLNELLVKATKDLNHEQ